MKNNRHFYAFYLMAMIALFAVPSAQTGLAEISDAAVDFAPPIRSTA